MLRSASAEAQGLQRARAGAFEEPACADLETVMPGWKTRRVESKPRATGDSSAEGLPASQHCGVFRAEADGFAKLYEMSGMKTASV